MVTRGPGFKRTGLGASKPLFRVPCRMELLPNVAFSHAPCSTEAAAGRSGSQETTGSYEAARPRACAEPKAGRRIRARFAREQSNCFARSRAVETDRQARTGVRSNEETSERRNRPLRNRPCETARPLRITPERRPRVLRPRRRKVVDRPSPGSRARQRPTASGARALRSVEHRVHTSCCA